MFQILGSLLSSFIDPSSDVFLGPLSFQITPLSWILTPCSQPNGSHWCTACLSASCRCSKALATVNPFCLLTNTWWISCSFCFDCVRAVWPVSNRSVRWWICCWSLVTYSIACLTFPSAWACCQKSLLKCCTNPARFLTFWLYHFWVNLCLMTIHWSFWIRWLTCSAAWVRIWSRQIMPLYVPVTAWDCSVATVFAICCCKPSLVSPCWLFPPWLLLMQTSIFRQYNEYC